MYNYNPKNSVKEHPNLQALAVKEHPNLQALRS